MAPSLADTDHAQDCIRACDDTGRICAEASMQCLAMRGEHLRQNHITLLFDCAAICHQCMNFLLRRSAFTADICRLCASICESCDASCRDFNDKDMTDCADACRACAVACRRMVAKALIPASVS